MPVPLPASGNAFNLLTWSQRSPPRTTRSYPGAVHRCKLPPHNSFAEAGRKDPRPARPLADLFPITYEWMCWFAVGLLLVETREKVAARVLQAEMERMTETVERVCLPWGNSNERFRVAKSPKHARWCETEMQGSDRVPDLKDYKRAWVGHGKTFHESEMALFSECMPQCAQKLLDTADIVRDAIFRQPGTRFPRRCLLYRPARQTRFRKLRISAWRSTVRPRGPKPQRRVYFEGGWLSHLRDHDLVGQQRRTCSGLWL